MLESMVHVIVFFCACMIIARGWNFLFHAGNRLCDECGDRAVEIPPMINCIFLGGIYIMYVSTIGIGVSLAILIFGFLQKRIEPNKRYIPALVCFGAWKGKERKNPRLKRKVMDRRPSSRLVVFFLFFFLSPPFGKGNCMNGEPRLWFRFRPE